VGWHDSSQYKAFEASLPPFRKTYSFSPPSEHMFLCEDQPESHGRLFFFWAVLVCNTIARLSARDGDFIPPSNLLVRIPVGFVNFFHPANWLCT